MHADWWTLTLQTVNFAVLVWLLRRFLYRPVLRLVDARKEDVQRQFDRAKAMEDQAAAHLAAVQAERAAINTEREASLKAAANQARQAARTVRERAEREAQAVIEGAKENVAIERAHLLEEARRTALDLASDYARRLLLEVPPAMSAEGCFERAEQYLKSLPQAQLEPLVRQLADGAVLIVTTASALPPAMAEVWRGRLGQLLGSSARVTYEVKPEILAGAELQFPNAVLRFSLQSALATLRCRIDADGRASEMNRWLR